MSGYKIAVILEEIGQSYQSAILDGIAFASEQLGFNVSAFTSFNGEMDTPRHDIGEFNIFNLPDFSSFDGAILLTNTISSKKVVASLLDKIISSGIPAVSIDRDVKQLYHIGIDNTAAMRQITEHMIHEHGFSRFAYISGPAANTESSERLAAFCTVLDENNLDITENAVFYGTFRGPSGREAVDHFIKNLREMPEAIICANDVMAASAIDALITHGYKVPDDIAVTGFDNTYNYHNFLVELTSVERPMMLSGQLACQMLYDHFQGLPQARSVMMNMAPKFTESCGCRHNAVSNISKLKEINYRNYSNFENITSYMSALNRMSTRLLACNNYVEYIKTLKQIVVEIAPDEFYFCLCDNWDSGAYSDSAADASGGEQTIPTNYTEDVIVTIAYVDGEFVDCGRIKAKDILPPAADTEKNGKIYYISPLHFAERCLGYMAIRSPKQPMQNIMYQTFCINVCNSLENIRKLICLEYAVDRLGSLYTQDTFSGIYNRNGFVQETSWLYNDCIRNHRSIMLMFLDLDGLKSINDTYGHSIGDKAIRSIAEILRNSCTNGEIFCRFGGDEFIIFGADYTDEMAKRLSERINHNVLRKNESGKFPFTLSASIGHVIATPKEGEDIFSFVTDADKQMYKEKRKKKHSRYLKS